MDQSPRPNLDTLALATGVGYIVLLAVDTIGVAWLVRRDVRISP